MRQTAELAHEKTWAWIKKGVPKRLTESLLIFSRIVPLARISLTLSRHFSLSGRSSGLHPVSSHSCCMYVRAGRPALARPYVGVHSSTSFMSSSLLLQQCPACLVRLTWMFSWWEVGGNIIGVCGVRRKHCLKDQLNWKLTAHNRIASVGYVET